MLQHVVRLCIRLLARLFVVCGTHGPCAGDATLFQCRFSFMWLVLTLACNLRNLPSRFTATTVCWSVWALLCARPWRGQGNTCEAFLLSKDLFLENKCLVSFVLGQGHARMLPSIM